MFNTNIFDYVEPRKIGNFELQDKIIDEAEVGFMSPYYAGQRIQLLTHLGEVVMSDTSMEKRTNREFAHNAHGDVLIGGLGIGMIILEVQDNPHVDSITVVEKFSEVIELMKDLPFNDKVTIINEDVFDFKPNGKKYDYIYLDIWNNINREVYEEEMKPLKAKYRRQLKSKIDSPNRKVFCWAEYQAKNNLRLI